MKQHSFSSILLILLLISGCTPAVPRLLDELTREQGFTPVRLQAEPFTLFGLVRSGTGEVLHVVIEGDGFAWQNRHRPSTDPTPRDTVALRLAAADASGAPVLYLARPGQYPASATQGRNTDTVSMRYWTTARFAPEVVRSLDAAISEVQQRTGTRRVRLAGFSGGGALAVLVAARRDDVDFLITWAGALDHAAWTAHHKVTPLRDSLNPVDVAPHLTGLPQRHVSSRADTTMPPHISANFCRALGRPEACVVVETLPHNGAWERLAL